MLVALQDNAGTSARAGIGQYQLSAVWRIGASMDRLYDFIGWRPVRPNPRDGPPKAKRGARH
jgi:hypothetical protein